MRKTFILTTLIVVLLCANAPLSGKPTGPAVTWFDGEHPVTVNVCTRVSPVVEKALELFRQDMRAVTGRDAVSSRDAIIKIYQTGAGESDAFSISANNGHIIIKGDNGRGTAYGILELSRLAGVTPWVWWGDAAPEHRSRLSLPNGYYDRQMPSVAYRGIFINDEDWSLRNWSYLTADAGRPYGRMGHNTYRRIFELMLRLRANTLWPAMHPGTTGFFQVDGNKQLADSFGIVLGSSHCEPLLRNNVAEWDEKQHGEYNFITNRSAVEQYWAKRLQEMKGSDALFTIGMRGIHDGSMLGVKTDEEKLKGLQAVINSQRELIAKYYNKHVSSVPQVFIPYKEVLQIYESGLKVPDDVTLMWCDDNYGYLTRLSDSVQQQRSGGAGVYYHLSYWGRPHDYLWLTTTQPGLIYNELKLAYDHQARKLWIVNVHDPKVAAYDLQFFMDMAWNINSIHHNTITLHLTNWLKSIFGQELGAKLLAPMLTYYKLCAVRKPEFMGWSQVECDNNLYDRGLTPVRNTEFKENVFGNELQHYLSDWQNTATTVEKLSAEVPESLRDAFFAFIQYPVTAAAAMAEKQLEAQRARECCAGSTDSTITRRKQTALRHVAKSLKAYEKINHLTETYNKEMAHGKWNGLMDNAPRDLPVFNPPLVPFIPLPDAQLSALYSDSKEGAPCSWPDTNDSTYIAMNACNYTTAGAGIEPIQMLGHSMNAVAVPKGQWLEYAFTTTCEGKAMLTTALIPTQANDKGDIRYSVSIDGATPIVYSLKEPYRSERWKENVLRGQSRRTSAIWLGKGKHTLRIKALDNHIIVDQWLIDFNPSRRSYMLPVNPEM